MSEARVDDALSEALVALAHWLSAARVPYALIGGLAVALQAAPRFTKDIDLVVWTDDARWPELVASAEPFSIMPRRADVLAFAQRTRVLLLAHSSGVPLDISCGALPFEQELVERAEPIDVGAVVLQVATPVHLLVMKAIANRPRDRADIETLLRTFPDVDTVAARAVVQEFADALEAPELLSDFDRLVRDSQPR
ncbi:MAG: nucleotidyl transferase AbiEii/AbiGii toxin family protein [Vicinamibacteria bacterium]|nr:nucleotidyl transferase AbiEii/AbiGii toxin family protein [Vicinamibacteria bacterium]